MPRHRHRHRFRPAAEPLDSRLTPSAPFPLPYGPANAPPPVGPPSIVEGPPSPALLLMHPDWPEIYSELQGLQDALNALPPPPMTPAPLTYYLGHWWACPCPVPPTDPIP